MLKIVSCLAYEHDYRALALATVVCVFGSIMAMRLFARTRRTTGAKRANWIFLAGVVCGCAIWTTHFVAMLGFNPPLRYGYDPMGTLISLFLAIGFSTIGMFMASSTKASPMIEAGGAVLGFGIVAMHYAGMLAFRVTGRLEWDPTLVCVSIFCGCFFGAIALNRIARPVTRFCKYGASVALFIAIITTHSAGMGAFTIIPDLSIIVPAKSISNAMLAVGVLAIMSLVMGTGISSYLIDTHTQEEAIRRYRHLALHDSITGLPNRAHLSTRLSETIERAKDDTSRIAIIAIDLDRFKDINDVHGHASGDYVLKALAERLSNVLADDEFLARVGGDEFVAVKQRVYAKGNARAFAEKIRTLICQPIQDDDRILNVGASLGISLYPDHGEDIDDLISRADLAMYRAKQSAAEKICVYDASMDETSRLRSALAMELRHAVERDELELHYQPQYDVATGDLFGFEALVRWNHPTRGMVSPINFIPIAESTGLIIPIGEWVLKHACREAASWERPLKIAVNVAPAQFAQGNLPRLVHETLLETGLAANRLELEITESSIIDDHQHALHIVRQLKCYGVSIAMDDYGTGYSSLSTLQTFPFDKIKIDQSFINVVDKNDQASAIVKSTIILAESLNIPVLAEGVETIAHLDFLRGEGCQEAQGYYFSRPLPVAEIRRMISQEFVARPADKAVSFQRPLETDLLLSA